VASGDSSHQRTLGLNRWKEVMAGLIGCRFAKLHQGLRVILAGTPEATSRHTELEGRRSIWTETATEHRVLRFPWVGPFFVHDGFVPSSFSTSCRLPATLIALHLGPWVFSILSFLPLRFLGGLQGLWI
jgi:hypothetical protein